MKAVLLKLGWMSVDITAMNLNEADDRQITKGNRTCFDSIRGMSVLMLIHKTRTSGTRIITRIITIIIITRIIIRRITSILSRRRTRRIIIKNNKE